jgi:hypothetical protein
MKKAKKQPKTKPSLGVRDLRTRKDVKGGIKGESVDSKHKDW